MYDIVVIGNPTFTNGRLTGPSIYAAATAAKIGFEQMALVSSLGPTLTEKFIQQVDALDIPEYFIIEANNPGIVEFRNPSLTSDISVLGTPHKINIRNIPEEFLKTQAILLSPPCKR